MACVEAPRLGIELELMLLAYATTIAMQDLSCICDLHHSSWQRQILNPLCEAREKPATSWYLVGFVSAAPRRELPELGFCSSQELAGPRALLEVG